MGQAGKPTRQVNIEQVVGVYKSVFVCVCVCFVCESIMELLSPCTAYSYKTDHTKIAAHSNWLASPPSMLICNTDAIQFFLAYVSHSSPAAALEPVHSEANTCIVMRRH